MANCILDSSMQNPQPLWTPLFQSVKCGGWTTFVTDFNGFCHLQLIRFFLITMCSHQYLEVKFSTTWLLGGPYYNEGNLRQNSITHAHTLASRHKLFCKLRKVPIICSVLFGTQTSSLYESFIWGYCTILQQQDSANLLLGVRGQNFKLQN